MHSYLPALRPALFFYGWLCFSVSDAQSVEPLFENSVVSNDIDFIRSDDPSIAFEIVEKGLSRAEMPDKRSNKLFREGVLTFQIKYDDGVSVRILTASELVANGTAARYAEDVGSALGKLPRALRKGLSHVIIHSGDETAFAEEQARFFVLYSQNIDRRIKTHDLEETCFHETIHATLEAEHAANPVWIQAQESDPGFITRYAAKHPKKEDLPESALFAYIHVKFPDRLPVDVAEAIHTLMPKRLEYLQQLFESLEKEGAGFDVQ